MRHFILDSQLSLQLLPSAVLQRRVEAGRRRGGCEGDRSVRLHRGVEYYQRLSSQHKWFGFSFVFLKYVHDIIKDENVVQLLVLADKFLISLVKNACEAFLVSLSDLDAVEKFRLADTYTLLTLEVCGSRLKFYLYIPICLSIKASKI